MTAFSGFTLLRFPPDIAGEPWQRFLFLSILLHFNKKVQDVGEGTHHAATHGIA